jgi:hypothetical protein
LVLRSACALLATALLAGCMPRLGNGGEPRSEDFTVGSSRFRIVYWPGDASAARTVREALEKAAPHVERWGGLRQPVTVRIHPSHDALEGAVDRQGYDWLKAWARYDTVELQSPRTWGWFGVRGAEVEALLTHELTHCAMYQAAGDDLTWMFKEIPVWFSEGLADVAAKRGARYGGIEELWRYYQEKLPGSGGGIPGRMRVARYPVALPGDPIVDPGPIYQEQYEIVYGAAYYAVEFLIRRYGDEKVKLLLERMGSGYRFPTAFKDAIGLTDAEFASDFRRYVVWQGWRKGP